MICAGCGTVIPELPETGGGCGRCAGSCRKIHCPYCGFENPLIPDYLQRLQGRTNDKKE